MRYLDLYTDMTCKYTRSGFPQKVGISQGPNMELFLAIIAKDKDSVRDILDSGVSANAQLPGDTTPLLFATALNLPDIVSLLLERGANIHDIDMNSGNTPLMNAIVRDNTEIAINLLGRDALIDVANSQGNTPLHLVALTGNKLIAEDLIFRGADIDAVNIQGKTPLQLAMDSGNQDMINLLRTATMLKRIQNERHKFFQMYCV